MLVKTTESTRSWPAKTTLLRIGELAEQSGTPASTIRYYEQLGLIPEVKRTQGNSRRYTPGVVLRLQMIRSLQNMGFALADIPVMLRDEQKSMDHDRVLHAVDARLEEMTRLIESMQQQRNQLLSVRDLLQRTWSEGKCVTDEQLMNLGQEF